jgi:hypothetical protein
MEELRVQLETTAVLYHGIATVLLWFCCLLVGSERAASTKYLVLEYN